LEPADQLLSAYVEVLTLAGGLTRWDDLVTHMWDGADVIEAGAAAIMAQAHNGSIGFAEANMLLDSAKAITTRHLMLRRALAAAGLDPHVVLARSDPDELSSYLKRQPHPTAVFSLHLLGGDALVLFIATNFPIPGQRGPGGSYHNCMRVNRVRDSMLPAIDDYTDSVNAGSPDFTAIEEPLAFLGSALLALLAGTLPAELIFIPHRMLHVLPLHAMPLDDTRQTRLPDVVSTIRYCSSVFDLTYGTVSLSDDSKGTPRILSVIDENSTLPGIGIEKQVMATYAEQVGGSAIVETACEAAQLPADYSDHVWINWNSHARSSTNSWGDSYLVLGSHRISARAIAADWRLPRRPHVVLAACQTALDTSSTTTIDEYCGLDLAFRIAGAKSVVASMWSANDPVAALTSMLVSSSWLQGGKSPAQLITALQRGFRDGVWQRALLRPEQLRQLPSATAERIRAAQEPFWQLPADAFTDPASWAVFRCHG
jgi:hypothetical protein